MTLTTDTGPVVSVRGLGYAYQDGSDLRFVLRGVSCDFMPGRFYAVLGNSGSGKTTLLSLMAALDAPREGAVLYRGRDIRKIGHESYRRNHMGIVFQGHNLVPWLTAVENVLVAMAATDNELPSDQRRVAENLLKYLGIDRARSSRRVTALSGGEQQRVAIARALATNAELVLADEPTGNLDEATAEEVALVFGRLAREHGKCVVAVTHSMEVARHADVVLRLSRGSLAPLEGAPAQTAPAPR
jgi:putative ABC transport system ATP-binding protein